MKFKLAINGFGRIGRSFIRAAVNDKEFLKIFEITAINDIGDIKTLSHLLKYDSTFGKFTGDIKMDPYNKLLIINDMPVRIFSEYDINKLPWKTLGIDIVLESTGKFTNSIDAQNHIKVGARKVIISAPSKDADITMILGINDNVYEKHKHNIISMASCTTNSLAPVVKVINDQFGIETAYMTTTHAYTNDQKLLDSHHKDLRRSRSANMSIIPTSTGAAKSIGQVIPELNGKIDGLALRVPVNNGSVADIVFRVKKTVSKDEVNEVLKQASETNLNGILSYTEEPIVSSDIIGDNHSSIVDGLSTMVLGEKSKNIKILSWYDNEWGFACRIVDILKFLHKNS